MNQYPGQRHTKNREYRNFFPSSFFIRVYLSKSAAEDFQSNR